MADAMRFPHWSYDPGALCALLSSEGYADFESACHMRPGRLESLGARRLAPYLWEFRRMALVLDMDMDDLFDAIFTTEQG